jgi:hypothetical protein
LAAIRLAKAAGDRQGASMPHAADNPTAVLVVAERAVDPQSLIALMRERDQADHCQFTLLVPAVAHGLHRYVDPEDQCCAEAQHTIDILRLQLERATGDPVETIIGAHEPLATIQDALNNGHFDKVILTSHASRLSRWAHVDLRRKVADLDRQIRVLSIDADVRARGVHAPAAA